MLTMSETHSNIVDQQYGFSSDFNRPKEHLFSGMDVDSDSNNEASSQDEMNEFDDSFHSLSSSGHPRRKRYSLKTRKIRNYRILRESDSEEESSEEVHRTRRTRRVKRKRGEAKDAYPTKNFLPAFKGPHLQFLSEQKGMDYMMSFPLIQDIKEKNGISMTDYEKLYKVPEFEEVWKEMFETRYLYRAMMLSRSTAVARKIHVKKIPVFQEAFVTKIFNRIN